MNATQTYQSNLPWALAKIPTLNETFGYDGNGNILTALRNNGLVGGLTMDDLGYVYDRDGNGRLLDNKLLQVKDAVEEYKYPGDLDNQEDLRNYHYDAIGNLTHDTKEGIDSVEWTVYGKIRSISKSDGTNIGYAYGPSGNRTSKTVNGVTTWYVRDAQGNVMGLYDNQGGGTNWREQHLYGSSRLGTWNPNINLSNTNGTAAWDTIGKKSYELVNHLGNVMATITDKRLQHSTDGSLIDYYDADVQSAQEYYAFGSIIPGRTYSAAGKNYRYGFNGKENDNEVKKDGYGNPNIGSQQDYGMRINDLRLGRFLSTDPLTGKYPWYTPYQFAGNSPIVNIDLDGLERVNISLFQALSSLGRPKLQKSEWYQVANSPNWQTFVPAAKFNTDNNNPGAYQNIEDRHNWYVWATENTKSVGNYWFAAAADVTSPTMVGGAEVTGHGLFMSSATNRLLTDANQFLLKENFKNFGPYASYWSGFATPDL